MEHPSVGKSSRDTAVAAARGVLGCIPVVGSIVSELVGAVIPGQRIERLESYVLLLAEHFRHLEADDLAARFRRPENIDMFEEGALQSARALSDERKRYIAALVARGISSDDQMRFEAKRLLNLLRELDDAEIVVLASKLGKFSQDEGFRERNGSVLQPVYAFIDSDRETVDADTVQRAVDAHLDRLGLTHPRFPLVKKHEVPEFDHVTGMIKSTGVTLAPLGLLLLRQIGLAGDDDY
jgi:hypothetical protein